MSYNSKPVYMYDLNYNFICKFDTTADCAIFFDYEREYINHNLKYCKKIRKNGKWYIISREEITKC